MENVIIFLFCLSAILSMSHPPQSKGWRGIAPLQSTRTDVEKLLGTPSNKCRCAYYLEDINVFVVYAEGDCNSRSTLGWNVPADTVIRFDVVPKKERDPSRLGIDLEGYTKWDDPEVKNIVYYTNETRGMTVAMNKPRNEVQEIHYGPTAEQDRDQRLRCPNFPPK